MVTLTIVEVGTDHDIIKLRVVLYLHKEAKRTMGEIMNIES